MPDRVFRDEILSSPRYWQLSSDTGRMLFYHLGLRADDLGIFRAANYTIRQECFGADNKPAPEALSKILAELSDADLIRLYQVDGAEFGFIPRWHQRLRIIKNRFPLPPESIRDNAINNVISKMYDGCPTAGRHLSAEEKRREENRIEEKKGLPLEPPVDKLEKAKGLADIKSAKIQNPWWVSLESMIAKAAELGIVPFVGEERDSLYKRVKAAMKAHA